MSNTIRFTDDRLTAFGLPADEYDVPADRAAEFQKLAAKIGASDAAASMGIPNVAPYMEEVRQSSEFKQWADRADREVN